MGRVGKGMLSGEDSELARRVIAAGRRLRYEPSAVTYHPVEEFRVHRKYFLEWWFNKGRSDVREFGNQANKLHILGIPRSIISCIGRGISTMDVRSRAISTFYL